jgi:hypothetical protein
MARMLAGDPPALKCASLGEPLLPVAACEALVYGTAVEMFEAYQGIRARSNPGILRLLPAWRPRPKADDFIKRMRVHVWHLFAKHDAESNRSPIDPERLSAAHTAAARLLHERSLSAGHHCVTPPGLGARSQQADTLQSRPGQAPLFPR